MTAAPAPTFESLHIPEPLLRGLYSKGYDEPSQIQYESLRILQKQPFVYFTRLRIFLYYLPHSLRSPNFIGQAQTGSGKTMAFLLHAFMICQAGIPVKPQVIILAPTRELSNQIYEDARALIQYQDKLTVKRLVFESDIQALSSDEDGGRLFLFLRPC